MAAPMQSWQGGGDGEPGPFLETLADDVLQDSFLRRSVSDFLQTLSELGPAVDPELQVAHIIFIIKVRIEIVRELKPVRFLSADNSTISLMLLTIISE